MNANHSASDSSPFEQSHANHIQLLPLSNMFFIHVVRKRGWYFCCRNPRNNSFWWRPRGRVRGARDKEQRWPLRGTSRGRHPRTGCRRKRDFLGALLARAHLLPNHGCVEGPSCSTATRRNRAVRWQSRSVLGPRNTDSSSGPPFRRTELPAFNGRACMDYLGSTP